MDGVKRGENLAVRRAPAANPGIDTVAACWSCHGPVDTAELFCGTCAAVQPPGRADHFTRLGLGSAFDVDPVLLDRHYFDRQRQLHPDRFATRTPRERALSQSQATAVNEAYETLKDPLRRADYLLRQSDSGATPQACYMINDMALLTEAMEMREALAEAADTDAVTALAERTADDIARCIAELSHAFANEDFETAARQTTRLKYLRKLADDCRIRRLQLARP